MASKSSHARTSHSQHLKELEAELRKVEIVKSHWLTTIDALIDPLMIVSPRYLIKKANKALAALAGRDVKKLIGNKCYEALAQRDSPCPGCQIKKALRSAEACSFELAEPDGKRFYEAVSQPIFDRKGKVEGVVQVYRDRTDARTMQAKLAQQDKLASIGLLAGGIAHEINNPLGGILIFSQMLLREIPKKSRHYQDVVEIESATQRCKAIVEGLLDFARIHTTEKSGSNLKAIDLRDAIEAAVRFGKVSIPRGVDIALVSKLGSVQLWVHADKNRMIQLFLNLMQNALQAMPNGGEFTVKAQIEQGEAVVVTVTDTGSGIAPEHLSKIFDPFFTTKDPGQGTGLGLALCHTMISEVNGEITVKSQVGIGTTFNIRVPLAKRTVRPRRKVS